MTVVTEGFAGFSGGVVVGLLGLAGADSGFARFAARVWL